MDRARQRWVMSLMLVLGVAGPVGAEGPTGLVMFDFEEDMQGWEIPDWAKTSQDYVGKIVSISQETASNGEGSLQMLADFPGGKWAGAYTEVMMYVNDWSAYQTLAADVYVPASAPAGLKARFILTVSDKWEWTEMNRGIALEPGRWTTIKANLTPSSLDWKAFPTEAFRKDIRKVGLRVESDKNPVYTGPVYVDNIRLLK